MNCPRQLQSHYHVRSSHIENLFGATTFEVTFLVTFSTRRLKLTNQELVMTDICVEEVLVSVISEFTQDALQLYKVCLAVVRLRKPLGQFVVEQSAGWGWGGGTLMNEYEQTMGRKFYSSHVKHVSEHRKWVSDHLSDNIFIG